MHQIRGKFTGEQRQIRSWHGGRSLYNPNHRIKVVGFTLFFWKIYYDLAMIYH